MVRIHGTQKALAMSTDCTPRYCYADPYEGGKQAVAEIYRNISAVGATPLAITNCLNFANPQRPEIMAQIVGCLEGHGRCLPRARFPDRERAMCRSITRARRPVAVLPILPTPAIGGVGLMADHDEDGDDWLQGRGRGHLGDRRNGNGHLGQSLWLREMHGREDGAAPARRSGDRTRQRRIRPQADR